MRIFLDDERFPVTDDFVICRSLYEFGRKLAELEISGRKVEYISFDHDLGNSPNGLTCAKELVNFDMNAEILATNFSFYVHSQNPVGAKNIQAYLDDYLSFKNKA